MFWTLALLIGLLYAAGLYLMLQRSIIKIVFGLVLLGHAANLLIFTTAGLVRARPALIAAGENTLRAGASDPVPQALVLTAIVIGFAVAAFSAVLVRLVCRDAGCDDPDEMRNAAP